MKMRMKNMKSFLKEIENRILIFDGSKGYMLQRLGMKGGECPELWNAIHPEEVREIYRLYKSAGADVIQTNTFQGSRIQLEKYQLSDRTYELNYEGARLAREVMGKDGYVAASIGPTGMLLEPLGELTFEYAYEIFREQVKAVIDGGVDIINFETFTDVAEMRAALIAAKEISNLPVVCSMAFESNGRTLMGTDPYTASVILQSLGADMVGTNCSFGPAHMLEIIKKMSEAGGTYLSAKPNAGLPELVDGEPVYRESPEQFAALAVEFAGYGARLIGGCCGTTPEFISAIKEKIAGLKLSEVKNKPEQIITSNVRVLSIEKSENLNIGLLSAAADNNLLKELSSSNLDFVADLSMELSSEDFDAVYVNVDKAAVDENLLGEVVNAAQSYIKAPFIIETGSAQALDRALKIYKGKAGIVVDGYRDDIVAQLLMVGRKYGSTVITFGAGTRPGARG